jgi:hypothetical protein
MPDPSAVVQQQLNDAFESFKTTLQDLLTAEARRSVDGAVERISGEIGNFRLDDISVEVVIKDLKLSSTQETPATAPAKASARPRRATPARRTTTRATRRKDATPGKRGRPVGGVRLGVLAAFAGSAPDLSTDDIRASLQAAGVKTSTDNLHQQLRRLVQAGELTRTGRGRYARAASTQAP